MFRARDVVGRGLLTPDALRSSAWRRLYRGVCADAALPLTSDLRIAGAGLLIPPDAVFSGRTAAHLLGAPELFAEEHPVEVTLPPSRRFGPVAGLRVRCLPLTAADLRTVGDRRCTTGLRTAVDLARFEPPIEAVVALDVLVGRAIAFEVDVREVVAALPVGRGTRRAREAVRLMNGRAESPQETRLRVLLTLAGLAPVAQYRVRDADGVELARVDLAYPDQRLAIEYDGVWHADGQQFRHDRRRLNRLVEAGWTVLHVTAADLERPQELVTRVRRLLAPRETGLVGV